MILQELAVAGFRTFADTMAIGPFDERITVIHAPNGTGKTTLLDAFYHGLLESHAVTGGGVKEMMQSSGRDLVPQVSVTFVASGIRYRLEKRFLNRPEARLSREEAGRFVPFIEGDGALKFTRDLLMAESPGRGLIKRSDHFGLGSILWAPQQDVELTALKGDAANFVRGRLGGSATSVGPGDAKAATFAADWWAHFFTKKGESKAEGSAALPTLRMRLAEATTRQTAAKVALDDLETLRAVYLTACAERVRLEKVVAELEAEVTARTADVAAYEQASHAHELAAGTLTIAAERYTNAVRTNQHITDARRALIDLEQHYASKLDLQSRAGETEAIAREGIAHRQQLIEAVALAIQLAEQDAQVARDAASFVSTRVRVSDSRRRLAELADLREKLEMLVGERAQLTSPSAEVLDDIRTAVTELRRLQDALASSVVHVEFEASTLAALYVSAGQATGPLRAENGDNLAIAGAPAVEFTIDGIGTIRARGPHGTYDEIRQAQLAAGEYHAELLRPFGTNDVVELERRRAHAMALDHEIAMLEERILDREREGGDARALREQVVIGEGQLASFAAQYPEWTSTEPDSAVLEREAEQRLTLTRQARTAETAAHAAATTDAEVAMAKLRSAQDIAATANAALEKAKGQLQAFEVDGLTDAEREAQTRNYGLAQIAAQASCDQAAAVLAAFAADPRPGFESLKRKLKVTIDDRGTAHTAVTTYEAHLESKNAAGPYDAYANAEAEVAELDRHLKSQENESRAARLLHETFLEVEAKREQAVIAPLRERTAELYRRVSGVANETLHFDANMTLKGLERGGDCLLQTLSGGEREQLNLLARLALADLITDGERQLVVLDDSLTATDPHRFERFLQIVEEFAETRMQFVIATCDKQRYASLRGAKFIDLQSLRYAAPSL